MPDIFTTQTLAGVVRSLHIPQPFLLQAFFPDVITFDTEDIVWDKVLKTRKLAPFVAPTVAGKPRKKDGYRSETFRPAYLKPKNALEPSTTMRRRAGETLSGSLSPQQRRLAMVGEILGEHEEMRIRRMEWMAAEVLKSGAVTVVGEDYPTQTVDFGRVAGHTIALAGASRWGESGVEPIDNLKSWVKTVQQASGAAVTMIVMTSDAYELMSASAKFEKVIRTDLQANSRFELGPIGSVGVQYVGQFSGTISVYTYDEIYEDDDGNAQPFLPAHSVILGGPGIAGAQCFGAILDHESLQPTESFPKMWRNPDPSVDYIMTQSAPLIVPGRVDATLAATVR